MSVVKVNDTYFNIAAVSAIGPIILMITPSTPQTTEKQNYGFNVVVTGFRIDLKFDSKDLAEISRDHFVNKWKSVLDGTYEKPVVETHSLTIVEPDTMANQIP